MTVTSVLDRIDADLPNALDRLQAFLRIPSISTDPAYADACDAAADWLVAELRALGAEASKRPTPGRPMVVGHLDGDGPEVLFYGHYDVQPVDPLDLWNSPPFEPELQDTPNGRVIRGRGTADDKGQLMTFVEACRNWLEEHERLPAKITFFFEGEEESGSPSLIPFLKDNADELRKELALICDTGLFNDTTPAIITSLRGMLGQEVILRGASRDLHSGSYGGPAANPIKVLSHVLAGLHDDTGGVTLPGFYDGVQVLTDRQRADWDALGFEADSFLGEVGLSMPAGERDFSALEQIWARPTCEINGIRGGYAGDGFKTVLPAEAAAKISFRLVGTQDPIAIREAFQSYVRSMLPPDMEVEFINHGASQASVMEASHPVFEQARLALTEEWQHPATFTGAGGSIPVAGYFKSILGMDSLLAGWGKDDDGLHSPNEKYDVESFHKGTRSWARVLGKLAEG
ncbi:M20/M25/M40 family metallo-hydrolase [Tropicimonas sp. S265A]|uniref:M20/M25/M40 family metallo-hydrolase n=1 Tax=Tropicimonas sp. S265A TaxID=3415134 RepID=UPI003C7DFF49